MFGKWYISYPYLRFPMCFFSMFAWWPIIPIYKVLSFVLSKVLSFVSLTEGRDCSDYETKRFQRLAFSSFKIHNGLSYVHSVLRSSPFDFWGVFSRFEPLITLGLYCCLCESMIALMSSMSLDFIFSAESSLFWSMVGRWESFGEIFCFDEIDGKSS